jgi:hypothetical protein
MCSAEREHRQGSHDEKPWRIFRETHCDYFDVRRKRILDHSLPGLANSLPVKWPIVILLKPFDGIIVALKGKGAAYPRVVARAWQWELQHEVGPRVAINSYENPSPWKINPQRISLFKPRVNFRLGKINHVAVIVMAMRHRIEWDANIKN